MNRDLSTPQRSALAEAVRAGGLRRVLGGYWIARDATPEREAEVVGGLNEDAAVTQTVRALERRGLVRIGIDFAFPTPAAAAALTRLEAHG